MIKIKTFAKEWLRRFFAGLLLFIYGGSFLIAHLLLSIVSFGILDIFKIVRNPLDVIEDLTGTDFTS